jgi:uncharacterized protein (DUF433 family)
MKHAPIDIYDGHDPAMLPAYPLREAAHYLRLPPTTLRQWVRGRSYPVATGTARSEALIALPADSSSTLSFLNVVEAHVLAAVRREHRVGLGQIRGAVEFVRKRLGIDRPLAHVDFETDGVDLFVQHVNELLNVSQGGQVAMREVMRAHLKRIERDEAGLARRLWPFTRDAAPGDQPRVVVIDPRVQFGRPVLADTGVPTAILAERFRAGDSIEALATDYQCGSDLIAEALRCELRDAA